MFPAGSLSEALIRLDIPLMRFKTGTPVRLHADSIDYTDLEKQEGDEIPEHFSALTKDFEKNLDPLPCYIVYTNEKTHEIIRKNIHRSPLYSGMIKGIGPRYCPSIEDKVMRFADKNRHQLFIEPMGATPRKSICKASARRCPKRFSLKCCTR